MILSVNEAKEFLRIDGNDNDIIIEGLIAGAEEYITITTGIASSLLATSPLAKTTAKMLCALWYDSQQIDSEKLQRTIDNLLKSLTYTFTESEKQEAK